MEDDVPHVSANITTGARLLSSAIAFLFISFVFAFFYLKAVNSNGNFHPAHVNPQQGFGIAILVCVLAATASLELGRRQLLQAAESGWRTAASTALALGIAVVVLQVIQYFGLFKTAAGGYASVFWGWTLLFVVCWLGAIFWVETLVAQTLRGTAAADESSRALLRSSASGCVVLLSTLAGIEVVAYILLYLVK
jgi:heme/copper-type cytochrome/quinol oxidase subunit 3